MNGDPSAGGPAGGADGSGAHDADRPGDPHRHGDPHRPGDLTAELADVLRAVRDVAAEQAWLADAVEAVAHDEGRHAHETADGDDVPLTCRVCPLCQGLALLRQVRPEAYEHASVALGALTSALRALVTPEPGPSGSGRGTEWAEGDSSPRPADRDHPGDRDRNDHGDDEHDDDRGDDEQSDDEHGDEHGDGEWIEIGEGAG